MQDAQLAETQKTSITMSIEILDGGTTESHGETRWQRLHLQLRSGRLRNGKGVGAHRIPHHLMNGGEFGFLDGIPETGGVDRTPTHNTHLCSTVCSEARNASQAWLMNCTTSLCALKESVIGSAHVSPFVALSLAFYHEHTIFLIHSTFYHDTRTRTIGTTRSSPRTPRTSSTSPGSPSRQVAPSRITLA